MLVFNWNNGLNCKEVEGDYQLQEGEKSYSEYPSQTQLQTDFPLYNSYILRVQAQELLNKSDLVAIRCVKAGIVFPSDWQAYVTALRSIVSNGTGDIPTQPNYPSGT